jgi:Leucine-rich repeat (LRR) protein
MNRKTLAIDIHGKKRKISPKLCPQKQAIYCENKEITELYIAKDVRIAYCHNNLLTRLELTEGLLTLGCSNNLLTTLSVPESLTWLSCDKELFIYDECKVKQVNILYER